MNLSNNYFKGELNVIERALLFVATLCLIAPEYISSVVGAVLGIAVLAVNSLNRKRAHTEGGTSE